MPVTVRMITVGRLACVQRHLHPLTPRYRPAPVDVHSLGIIGSTQRQQQIRLPRYQETHTLDW